MTPREQRPRESRKGPAEVLGFLQLCADRRYHRKTMTEFERRAKLRPDQYWIEASAGGAPAFGAVTLTAAYAYKKGARIMGWAAHGDECGGFEGRTDAEMKAKLQTIGWERFKDFPLAEHWTLFGIGGKVDAAKLF